MQEVVFCSYLDACFILLPADSSNPCRSLALASGNKAYKSDSFSIRSHRYLKRRADYMKNYCFVRNETPQIIK